ncbi:hypothetical protein ACFOPX_01720 [Helicobacter baculiformis]|uniref:Outer membrane protein n=1 Tax=Helicobacter baculiformis TaxID=427351 RepID=A0ABV7ZFC0_9HELI|nr:hypothetical protein [Helicobacter baculiformis]
MQALYAKITSILQELQSALDISANNAHNQATMSQYNTVFNELKSLQAKLTQEVNNYDKALSSQRQNYDTKHTAYQKAKQEYQSKVQIYNNARNSVTTTLENATSICGNGNCSASQIPAFLQGAKTLVKDLKTLAALNPKFSELQYYEANYDGTHNVVSGQALLNGIAQAGGANNYFTNLANNIDPNVLQTSFGQLIALAAWFNAQAKAIEDLATQYGISSAQISTYMQGLLDNYQNTFGIIMVGKSYLDSAVPTATTALGDGPQFSLSNQLDFSYQNFAPQIQTAYHQLDAIPNISDTHTQIKPSLVPLAKSINQSSSKFFSSIGYNVDLLAGWQYFFSGHFGFSIHTSVGYGYINSPLFNSASLFGRLQDIKINLGSNLIYDFNTPTHYKPPVYYGMFVGVQGGSTNFVLNAKTKALWRASYDLELDIGFRFQFSSHILKYGINIPLIPHKINWQVDSGSFQLDESIKDIGFFITYEKLIF